MESNLWYPDRAERLAASSEHRRETLLGVALRQKLVEPAEAQVLRWALETATRRCPVRPNSLRYAEALLRYKLRELRPKLQESWDANPLLADDRSG
jgi:hypothetical protein